MDELNLYGLWKEAEILATYFHKRASRRAWLWYNDFV